MKKIILIAISVMFLASTALFAVEFPQDKLATSPGSEQDDTMSDAAQDATEAIGEGAVVAALLRGTHPARIPTELVSALTINNFNEARRLAIEILTEWDDSEVPDSLFNDKAIREATIKALRNASDTWFFHVVFRGIDEQKKGNFLCMYNRSAWAEEGETQVALGVEYIDFMAKYDMRALAEVLVHEFTPNQPFMQDDEDYTTLKGVRALHRRKYKEFQAPIFWKNGKNKVRTLTNRFTRELQTAYDGIKLGSESTGVPVRGKEVMRLTRQPNPNSTVPEVVSIDVARGMGGATTSMMVLFPGATEPVEMLYVQPLEKLDNYLADENDRFGEKPFFGGGPWVHMANRYSGTPVGENEIDVTLPLIGTTRVHRNWRGAGLGEKRGTKLDPELQTHLHGYWHNIRTKAMPSRKRNNSVSVSSNAMVQGNTKEWPWPSDSKITIKTTLTKDGTVIHTLRHENIGNVPTPADWTRRDSFKLLFDNLPEGDASRQVVRVRLKGETYTPLTDFDGKQDVANCIAKGIIESTRETVYDFTAPEGGALGDVFYDHNFQNLINETDGSVVVEVLVPGLNYKVRVTASDIYRATSGEEKDRNGLKSVQLFSPVEPNADGAQFVCVEPSRRMVNDPTNEMWDNKIDPETDGVLELLPGEAYEMTYKVEILPLELQEVTSHTRRETRFMNSRPEGTVVKHAEITKLVSDIENAREAVLLEAAPYLGEKGDVAVVIQERLLSEGTAKDGELHSAELKGKYWVQIQNLREIYGDDYVIVVESQDPSDIADEINAKLINGKTRIIGIVDSAIAARVGEGIYGNEDRFRVMAVDIASEEELKDGLQFININYLTLMGIAALEGNSNLFNETYRLVTGDNATPDMMANWVIRVLPQILTWSGDVDLKKAIRQLFDISA